MHSFIHFSESLSTLAGLLVTTSTVLYRLSPFKLCLIQIINLIQTSTQVSDLNMASSSRTRKCKNKADSFCYICGIYTLTRQRRNLSWFVKRPYKSYFQVPLDQEKNGLPTLCAITGKKCFGTGQKESERAYLLVYLGCGVNRKSISLTAVFVW